MSSLDDLRAKLNNASPDETMRKILQDQGDDGSKPRLVHHVAYFNTDDAMAEFSDYVRQAGYELNESPEKDAVAFSSVSPVVGVEFDEAVQRLKDKAGEHEGQYDGWGCSVVLDSE